MSVIEKSGVMKYKDKDGQVYIMLPITTADKVDGAVSFYEQELTEEEKAQARANIGAISANEVPESGGEQVQSDYDQNDSTAVDFIKNRPFYDVSETLFDKDVTTVVTDDFNNAEEAINIDVTTVQEGDPFEVIFNGESYMYSVNMDFPYFGNIYMYLEYMAMSEGVTVDEIIDGFTSTTGPMPGATIVDTGEDFLVIFISDTEAIFYTREAGTYHFTINKIIDGKQLDERFIPDTIARVSDVMQSDYDQNDPEAKDYIKNRPFYKDSTNKWSGNVTTEYSDSVAGNIGLISGSSCPVDTIGDTYEVIIDDIVHEGISKQASADGGSSILHYVGNLALFGSQTSTDDGPIEDTGESFLVLTLHYSDGGVVGSMLFTTTAGTYNVTINKVVGLKQLDEKFIPDTIARVADIEGLLNGSGNSGNTDIDFSSIPNLYTWKRYTSSPKEYTETENTEVIIGAAMGSQTSLSAYYADNISIVDGAFDSNGFTDSGQTDITTLQELIKGKYVRYGTGNTGSPYKYYYIPEDVTLSYSYSGYNVVGVRADKAYLLGVNDSIGTFIDLVASEESDAYPTSGQHTDGYWYEYYKLLGSNGIYIGSGDMPEGCVIQIDPDGEYEGETSEGSGSGKTLIGEVTLDQNNLTIKENTTYECDVSEDLQTSISSIIEVLNDGFDVLIVEFVSDVMKQSTVASYLSDAAGTSGLISCAMQTDASTDETLKVDIVPTVIRMNEAFLDTYLVGVSTSVTVKFYTISGGSGSGSGDTSVAEEELPAVTTEDNGKVLMVVDGKWAIGSLSTSGTALPSAEEASF